MIKKIVIIGASTGGPSHIQSIISDFDVFNNAVVLIAQHIGAEYIPSFVSQLQNKSQMQVHPVSKDTSLKEGNMYVLSGLCQLVQTRNDTLMIKHVHSSSTYNPDINYIFHSVASLCHQYKVLSLLLTGIGDDGAKGSKEIYVKGGACIAESEKSAVIYGMPRRAKELNPKIEVMHLHDMSKKIKDFVS